MYRVGIGFDAHRFVEGRKLIMGGVEIPYRYGLLGHSDADVLIHAISDSILGALGKSDIGSLFPNTDNRYKNISSLILLKEVTAIMHEKGYTIANCDNVIICEKPKLSPYINEMKKNIVEVLRIPLHSISIKATTTEKMGFTGREEGVAAKSIVLLKPK